ncbi:MAG: hypothetical protein PVS2B1_12900 [Candidatus Dormibacteraceae bacterium]
MDRGRHARIDKVEREVAIRDRVDAVCGQPLKAEFAPHSLPLQRKSSPGQRPRPERHRTRRFIGSAKTLSVPQQRLRMREQVVADRHRLGPLQVRVARHHPSRVRAGLGGELVHNTGDRADEVRGGKTAEEPEVQRDLVVA